MKNYEFTGETKEFFGCTLHQIRATRDFIVQGHLVICGEVGGWIEKEENLFGGAWVSGDAEVSGNACVSGNARVSGNASISSVNQIMIVGDIGSRRDATTFFHGKDGNILVNCGCFHGSLDEFREKVRKTHGNNKHGRVYMLAADMAEIQIMGEEK